MKKTHRMFHLRKIRKTYTMLDKWNKLWSILHTTECFDKWQWYDKVTLKIMKKTQRMFHLRNIRETYVLWCLINEINSRAYCIQLSVLINGSVVINIMLLLLFIGMHYLKCLVFTPRSNLDSLQSVLSNKLSIRRIFWRMNCLHCGKINHRNLTYYLKHKISLQ